LNLVVISVPEAGLIVIRVESGTIWFVVVLRT
jgi:hypothetical protein